MNKELTPIRLITDEHGNILGKMYADAAFNIFSPNAVEVLAEHVYLSKMKLHIAEQGLLIAKATKAKFYALETLKQEGYAQFISNIKVDYQENEQLKVYRYRISFDSEKLGSHGFEIRTDNDVYNMVHMIGKMISSYHLHSHVLTMMAKGGYGDE